MALQVSPDHSHLTQNGKPFFWLADTCWSAFTNISDDDWQEYLDLRARQGFNVLQINALPQWDRCGTLENRHPFPFREGELYDFSRILPEYFAHARSMCRAAVDKGFTLAIVVMWCNYVPDTWASHIFGGNVMPPEAVEPVVKTICDSFNEFDPVYIVSGDTGFDSEASIQRYRLVTDLMDRYAPGLLKAYHIKGRYDGLPQEFGERADLYLYQSGHNAAGQEMAHLLAESFAARTPRRPVINSEPCYEQMGYSHKAYGRFRRTETRWALWNSLLSGAGAGITYGAHGVWNWQKPNMPKNPHGGEGFLQALPWYDAVLLPGVADFRFAKRFFEELSITAPVPCQNILAQYADFIRAARSGEHTILYVPTNAPLTLHGDWSTCSVTAIEPETGDTQRLEPRFDGSVTVLPMHHFLQDVLIVLQPQQPS